MCPRPQRSQLPMVEPHRRGRHSWHLSCDQPPRASGRRPVPRGMAPLKVRQCIHYTGQAARRRRQDDLEEMRGTKTEEGGGRLDARLRFRGRKLSPQNFQAARGAQTPRNCQGWQSTTRPKGGEKAFRQRYPKRTAGGPHNLFARALPFRDPEWI